MAMRRHHIPEEPAGNPKTGEGRSDALRRFRRHLRAWRITTLLAALLGAVHLHAIEGVSPVIVLLWAASLLGMGLLVTRDNILQQQHATILFDNLRKTGHYDHLMRRYWFANACVALASAVITLGLYLPPSPRTGMAWIGGFVLLVAGVAFLEFHRKHRLTLMYCSKDGDG